MGKIRLVPVAIAMTLALSLLSVSVFSAAAQRNGSGGGGGGAQCGVAISGGNVSNATTLDIQADGGTAIGDSSGGSGNLADPGGGNNRDNNNGRHNNNNNNHRNNRHNWSAESLDSFAARLLQTETASAGNGGVATTSANGGAVSVGDINSGGNSGNAISVGDTNCGPVARGGGNAGGGNAGGGGGRGGTIRALPSTGVGLAETGAGGSLFFAVSSLGLAALSARRRFAFRFSGVRSR